MEVTAILYSVISRVSLLLHLTVFWTMQLFDSPCQYGYELTFYGSLQHAYNCSGHPHRIRAYVYNEWHIIM